MLVALAAAATQVSLLFLTEYTPRDHPVWFVLVSTLVLQAGMLAVAFVLGPLRRGSAGQLVGLQRLAPLRLVGWAAIAFFGSIAASIVYVTLAGAISERWVPEPLPPDIDFTEAYLFSFVSIALVAPFAEEVFFRGFLFAAFAKRYGFWVGAILSAAVFGAVHLELARLFPAMLSGVVFAAVYWRSGSLWPAILAHTGQNAIAFGLAA